MTKSIDEILESVSAISSDEKIIIIYNYWSDILAGNINLENGKKYCTQNFYNPDLLKYSIKDIKKSLKLHAYFYTVRRQHNKDTIIGGIGSAYVLLSNFDKAIETEIESPMETALAGIGKGSKQATKTSIDKQIKKITEPSRLRLMEKAQKLQHLNAENMKKLGKEWEVVLEKIEKFESETYTNTDNQSEKSLSEDNGGFVRFFLEHQFMIIAAIFFITVSIFFTP